MFRDGKSEKGLASNKMCESSDVIEGSETDALLSLTDVCSSLREGAETATPFSVDSRALRDGAETATPFSVDSEIDSRFRPGRRRELLLLHRRRPSLGPFPESPSKVTVPFLLIATSVVDDRVLSMSRFVVPPARTFPHPVDPVEDSLLSRLSRTLEPVPTSTLILPVPELSWLGAVRIALVRL